MLRLCRGHEKQIFVFSLPGGLTAPRPPEGGSEGGRPPTRGVWRAGAPQGAKNYIEYRPKATYVCVRSLNQGQTMGEDIFLILYVAQ